MAKYDPVSRKYTFGALALLIATGAAASEPSLPGTVAVKTSPGFIQRHHLKDYSIIQGYSCPSVFKAPQIAKDGTVCHVDPNLDLQNLENWGAKMQQIPYESYENAFLVPIRKKQVAESKCAADYLKLIDRNTAAPDALALAHARDARDSCLARAGFNLPETEKCHAEYDKVFGPEPRGAKDKPSAKDFQEVVLRDMYSKFAPMRKERENIEYNQKWVERAGSRVRGNSLPGSGASDAEKKKAQNELDQARSHLDYSKRRFESLQATMWSGLDSNVQQFVKFYIDQKSDKFLGGGNYLSEDEFLKVALDRANPRSFQHLVVDRMRENNDDRLADNHDLSKPLSARAKIEFVESGAILSYINQQAHPQDYAGLMCHMDAVYGKGRDASLSEAGSIGQFLLYSVGAAAGASAIEGALGAGGEAVGAATTVGETEATVPIGTGARMLPPAAAEAETAVALRSGSQLMLPTISTAQVTSFNMPSAATWTALALGQGALSTASIGKDNSCLGSSVGSVVTANVCEQIEKTKKSTRPDDWVSVAAADYKNRLSCVGKIAAETTLALAPVLLGKLGAGSEAEAALGEEGHTTATVAAKAIGDGKTIDLKPFVTADGQVVHMTEEDAARAGLHPQSKTAATAEAPVVHIPAPEGVALETAEQKELFDTLDQQTHQEVIKACSSGSQGNACQLAVRTEQGIGQFTERLTKPERTSLIAMMRTSKGQEDWLNALQRCRDQKAAAETTSFSASGIAATDDWLIQGFLLAAAENRCEGPAHPAWY